MAKRNMLYLFISFTAGALVWNYFGNMLKAQFRRVTGNSASWMDNPAFIRKYWQDLI